MQPVYLSINLKIFQGTIRCCCEHAKNNNNNNNNNDNVQTSPQRRQVSPQLLFVDDVKIVPCLYSSPEFCNVLLECIKLNSKFCENNANAQHLNVIDSIVSHHTNQMVVAAAATTVTNASNNNGDDSNAIEIPKPQLPTTNRITPTVSINVTDAENLNVCMCSLFASSDNVLAEQQEQMIGAICPRCQNIIKQQPPERKTLISKRMTLSNDIIVNRVDTHFLSLKTALAYGKRYEPYTPESVESHSPFAEPDILEYVQNDENELIEGTVTIHNTDDPFDLNNKRHTRTASLHSTGVSPLQLKSRLENLRKTSADATGMVNSCHLLEPGKNRTKRRLCSDKCCVIL